MPCSLSRTAEEYAAKGGKPWPRQRTAPVPVEHIAQSILIFRGHKVLLDAELAALYGVGTGRLNQQVRRQSASRRHIPIRKPYVMSGTSAPFGRTAESRRALNRSGVTVQFRVATLSPSSVDHFTRP
jgi:hypothetical protein